MWVQWLNVEFEGSLVNCHRVFDRVFGNIILKKLRVTIGLNWPKCLQEIDLFEISNGCAKFLPGNFEPRFRNLMLSVAFNRNKIFLCCSWVICCNILNRENCR